MGSVLARESGVQGSIPTRSNKTFSLEYIPDIFRNLINKLVDISVVNLVSELNNN